MPLTVTVKQTGEGTYTVSPVGSIDAQTHTILGTEIGTILDKKASHIIFDMKDVRYVSSAGISVVLTAEKALKLAGGSALIVHLQPQIRKVFDIVQALPPEQIFSSVQEMDQYLKEIQRKVKEGEME